MGKKIFENFAFNVKLNVTSVEREENLGTSMKSEKRTYLTLVMKIPGIAVHCKRISNSKHFCLKPDEEWFNFPFGASNILLSTEKAHLEVEVELQPIDQIHLAQPNINQNYSQKSPQLWNCWKFKLNFNKSTKF